MTDLGDASQILGIEIMRDTNAGTITLSQNKYEVRAIDA